MSNPSHVHAFLFADEASFADDAVVTYDERLPILGPVVLTDLKQTKEPSGRAMTYVNDIERHIRMPYEAEFAVELALTGHGSATTGAISETQLARILGLVLGQSSASQVGGTVNTPTDAGTFTVTGATLLAGGLCRVGTLGDGRGNGQWAAIDNASTVTLLTDLSATPNAADVIYAPELVYVNEDATANSAVTSIRAQFQTANAIYRAWGVYPKSIAFSLAIGTIPKCTITFGASKAVPLGSAPTWPPSVAKDEFAGQPVGSGSLFLADHGTRTRSTKTIQEYNFRIDLQVSPQKGHGLNDVYSNITSAIRVKSQASFDIVTLADASGTNDEYDAWDSDTGNFQHALMGLSAARDGACMGIYTPYITRVGDAPRQFVEDGVNKLRSHFLAGTSQDTASALELSNVVIGIG